MMSFYGIEIKDAVLLIVGIACVYLAYSWLRLMQVKRRKQKRVAGDKHIEPRKRTPTIDLIDDSIDGDDEADVVYTKPPKQFSAHPATEALEIRDSSPMFDRMVSESQRRLVQSQARELEQLRQEINTLQRQHAELQDEVKRLKATRNVSPLYSEAVSMAQHGLNAEGIAARCGISIAEAELVAALANKAETDPDPEQNEEYHGKAAARYAA